MKKINAVVLFLSALGLLTIGGVAWAATNTSGDPVDPPATLKPTAIAQRVLERKKSITVPLTTVQIQSIASKCTAAQTRLKNVQTKDKVIDANRKQVYADLTTELDTMISRLQKQNIDTTQLKAAQANFNSAINQYSKDALNYKTSVDDAVRLDCAKDPQGFEATLLSARQLRTQLAKDSAQIKAELPGLANVLTAVKNALVNGGN